MRLFLQKKRNLLTKKNSVQNDNEGIISYDEWYIRSKPDVFGDGDKMNEYIAYDKLYDEYLKNM
jgi:hypothetical protein